MRLAVVSVRLDHVDVPPPVAEHPDLHPAAAGLVRQQLHPPPPAAAHMRHPLQPDLPIHASDRTEGVRQRVRIVYRRRIRTWSRWRRP